MSDFDPFVNVKVQNRRLRSSAVGATAEGPRGETDVAEKLGTAGVHVVLQEAEWEARSCAHFSFQLSFGFFLISFS